jgi:TM2 domain-containing membrane protein YozV
LLILSLFVGGLGVDRFVLGDIGIGVLKLLTGGCFGILTIIDWFTIMGKTRQKNFETFMESIQMQNNFAPAQQNPNQPMYYQPNAPQNNQPIYSAPNATNNIEEIKKYKQLLDNGIITQEEFEQKKRELL